LEDLEKRTVTNLQVASEGRKVIQKFPKLTHKVGFPSALGGGEGSGFPIKVELMGTDLPKLAEFAQSVAETTMKKPGIQNALPNINLGTPELMIDVDRDRAADLGVKGQDIANTVRLLMSGEEEITTYREEGEQYPVKMMLTEEQRNDRQIMGRLMVPSTKQGQIRLDTVATITRGVGPSRIGRYNRRFSVPINVSNAPDYPLSRAIEDTTQVLNDIHLPPGYSYRFTGNAKGLDETTNSLIAAFLLATVFMYMVLAAQFESLVHPFIILLTLPLSIPFALISLIATGRTLNLFSALGVLLLLGIVKKNGILQIDYMNRLRGQGLPLHEAILEANRVRLRPILMTTFSIVAGLIPTAIGIGAGASQRSAIAVTIIGGQLLCLLLTLLVVPVSYSLVEDAKAWLARRRTVRAPLPAVGD
jgi:HAE1 family hydrophobic/amphiphilic exporter-1